MVAPAAGRGRVAAARRRALWPFALVAFLARGGVARPRPPDRRAAHAHRDRQPRRAGVGHGRRPGAAPRRAHRRRASRRHRGWSPSARSSPPPRRPRSTGRSWRPTPDDPPRRMPRSLCRAPTPRAGAGSRRGTTRVRRRSRLRPAARRPSRPRSSPRLPGLDRGRLPGADPAERRGDAARRAGPRRRAGRAVRRCVVVAWLAAEVVGGFATRRAVLLDTGCARGRSGAGSSTRSGRRSGRVLTTVVVLAVGVSHPRARRSGGAGRGRRVGRGRRARSSDEGISPAGRRRHGSSSPRPGPRRSWRWPASRPPAGRLATAELLPRAAAVRPSARGRRDGASRRRRATRPMSTRPPDRSRRPATLPGACRGHGRRRDGAPHGGG